MIISSMANSHHTSSHFDPAWFQSDKKAHHDVIGLSPMLLLPTELQLRVVEALREPESLAVFPKTFNELGMHNLSSLLQVNREMYRLVSLVKYKVVTLRFCCPEEIESGLVFLKRHSSHITWIRIILDRTCTSPARRRGEDGSQCGNKKEKGTAIDDSERVNVEADHCHQSEGSLYDMATGFRTLFDCAIQEIPYIEKLEVINKGNVSTCPYVLDAIAASGLSVEHLKYEVPLDDIPRLHTVLSSFGKTLTSLFLTFPKWAPRKYDIFDMQKLWYDPCPRYDVSGCAEALAVMPRLKTVSLTTIPNAYDMFFPLRGPLYPPPQFPERIYLDVSRCPLKNLHLRECNMTFQDTKNILELFSKTLEFAVLWDVWQLFRADQYGSDVSEPLLTERLETVVIKSFNNPDYIVGFSQCASLKRIVFEHLLYVNSLHKFIECRDATPLLKEIVLDRYWVQCVPSGSWDMKEYYDSDKDAFRLAMDTFPGLAIQLKVVDFDRIPRDPFDRTTLECLSSARDIWNKFGY